LLMLTSSLASGDADSALKAGFAACLSKPVRKLELGKTLANLQAPMPAADSRQIANNPAFSNTSPMTRILLVEDNRINQEVAKTMIRKWGFQVDVASNGEEALQALDQKQYALVLMDCMMPVMDGYAATAEIRRRQSLRLLPSFPIIALTANAMTGDREKCRAAGMDDYIAKPFNTKLFLQMVRKWTTKPGEPDGGRAASSQA